MPYYYVRLRKTEEHIGRLRADDLEHLRHIIDQACEDPNQCDYRVARKNDGTGWQPVVPIGYCWAFGQGLLHGSLIDRTPGLRDTIKMLGLSISPPGSARS